MEVYTIGFTKKPAEEFFGLLKAAGVKRLVDVRLNNVSQLAGFAKRHDLEFFLKELCGIEYVHEKELGNPAANRDSFRDGDGQAGRRHMRKLLSNGSGPALDRLVERAMRERIAVLCVEREQDRCHREVIIEMALEKNSAIEVIQIL